MKLRKPTYIENVKHMIEINKASLALVNTLHMYLMCQVNEDPINAKRLIQQVMRFQAKAYKTIKEDK